MLNVTPFSQEISFFYSFFIAVRVCGIPSNPSYSFDYCIKRGQDEMRTVHFFKRDV